jgi:hypothetical protein
MTVSVDEPIQVGTNTWELRWSSDVEDAQYRVYRNGRLVMQTRRSSAVFAMPAGEPHMIEILDSVADVPKKYGRPFAHLGWSATATATHYIVEQYVDDEWVLVATVQETGKQRWHSLLSALADDTTHQFRVTAVSRAGTGTPTTVSYTLVRAPDPPYVDVTYDSGTGNVTVAAAA